MHLVGHCHKGENHGVGAQAQGRQADRQATYHGIQVGEPVDQRWMSAKFLTKSIAKIVRRIGGYYEYVVPDFGHLDSKATRGRGLTNAPLSTHKYPFQCILLQNIFQRWCYV